MFGIGSKVTFSASLTLLPPPPAVAADGDSDGTADGGAGTDVVVEAGIEGAGLEARSDVSGVVGVFGDLNAGTFIEAIGGGELYRFAWGPMSPPRIGENVGATGVGANRALTGSTVGSDWGVGVVGVEPRPGGGTSHTGPTESA